MKHHLCHRENIQNLMDPHKLMRIPAGKLRHHLFFKGGKKIQAFHEKCITFYSSAVVLHRFCDRHVQFFPGHTLFRIHKKRGIQTFLLLFHSFRIVGSPVSRQSGFRCLTACVITGRTGKTGTVRSIKLVTCSVNILNICHEIPVVKDPAGSSKKLTLLLQEVC